MGYQYFYCCYARNGVAVVMTVYSILDFVYFLLLFFLFLEKLDEKGAEGMELRGTEQV